MNKFIGIDIPTYFLCNKVWYSLLPNICVMDDCILEEKSLSK